MTDGPKFTGRMKMRYPFKYALVFTDPAGEGEEGTVEAFFVNKTMADGTANRWNADMGKTMYAVSKIFPD